MASEAFTLALLLTLKDGASGGLDRFEGRLRSLGKTGDEQLKKLETLREDLNKDLAIGGAGLAGLKVLKDGVQVAADYQAVMTDLRASIAQTGTDGKVNYGKLAGEMMEAEAVAVRLGNKLPGTTADFAQMMQTLKQNGLDVKTIIGGAADAVGHLAVASNAVPKEIAADFARFGNLFKLKPEDFTPAADVFSRIYSSTGQTSAELIEAAKYFQGRAGQGLGISGLQDAEKYTRLFGFLGKQGMTGSMAGMGLTNFFTAYQTHRDKLDDLQAATGIKLDFFDKQGKFVGLDQVMEQMSQFDKLSAKDRTAWMDTMFGTLGAGVGNVMVDAKGWKAFNEEQNKTISLQDKSAMKAQDYNNKMEALMGTLTNLKVAVFEPMLPGATALLDKGNEIVGMVQTFVKAHPDIAKYGVMLLSIGSAAMVLTSGVKAATTAINLYRMASKFSAADGLVSHMNAVSNATERTTKTQAGFVRQRDVVSGSMVKTGAAAKSSTAGVNALGSSMATADKRAIGLRKNLLSLDNVFKAVLLLETANFTWDQIESLRKVSKDWGSLQSRANKTGQESYNHYRARKSIGAETTEREIAELTRQNPAAAETFKLLRPDPVREARTATSLMQMGNNQIQKNLDPNKKNWTDIGTDFGKILMGKDLVWDAPLKAGNPLWAKHQERLAYHEKQPSRSGWSTTDTVVSTIMPGLMPLLLGSKVAPSTLADRDLRGANYFQQRAPALADPQVMASFRKYEVPKMNLDQQGKADIDNMLKLAFPESFAASLTATIDQQFTGMFDQGSQAFVQAMSSLQQPIAGTAELFSGLPPTVTPVGQAFATLPQPVNDAGTAFGTLPQPIGDATGAFQNILPPAGRLPGAFNNIFTSASNVSTSLDSVSAKLANWQPPQAQVVSIPGVAAAAPQTPMFGVPGRAIGGVVERDGFAYVHAGNVITPARATRGLSGFNDLMSMARSRPTVFKQFPTSPAAVGNTANAPVDRMFRPISLSVAMPPMSQSAGASFSAIPRENAVSPFRSNTVDDVRRVGIYETKSVDNFASRLTQATSLVSEFSRSKQTEREAIQSLSIGRFADDVARTRTFDQTFTRRDETASSAVNFDNTVARRTDRTSSVSSLVNDLVRGRDESRFRIDEELIRDADRASGQRPSGSGNQPSASPSITVNAPFTFSPTITASTVAAVEKQLDEQYSVAKKRMLRQVAKKIEEGRLRA